MSSEVKFFEIRDRMTFIPVMAVRIEADGETQDDYLIARGNYGRFSPYVLLTTLVDCRTTCDPFHWTNARTLREAHRFIIENWPTLVSGAVVDVEFVLGEVEKPKKSERYGELFVL